MSIFTNSASRAVPGTNAEPAVAFRQALESFRARLDRDLEVWIDARRERAAAESPLAAELAAEVGRLVAGGGKRLRPALVDAAYRAFGGASRDAASHLAMATELLHTYLLVHDDIMDHAALRRGVATAHAAFAELHRERSWPGDSVDYGRSIAILVGDLAHTWAAELSRRHPEAEGDSAAVAHCFDTMSSEVIGGQYLEMTLPYRAARAAQTGGELPAENELLRALRLKSGRYSVERPLELGARLAGADDESVATLVRYGEAVGDAFQLQDDILGTFGEAEAVGKPVASDLEEGKYTFLVHHALAGASAEDRSWLLAALARGGLEASEVERGRQVIRGSGGLDAVERMIRERLDRARRTLDELPLGEEDRLFFLGFVEYLAGRDR